MINLRILWFIFSILMMKMFCNKLITHKILQKLYHITFSKNMAHHQIFSKYIFATFLLAFLHQSAQAQIDNEALGYYQDALRYGQNQIAGTARFQGLGGANVALGGDATSAWSNPAGLGFNRKSEISFTPSFTASVSNARFLNEENFDVKINPNIAQFALIFANNNGRHRDLRNGAFAITFTRVQDFQTRFTYSGINDQNSLIDYFLERNDQITPWNVLNDEGTNGITSLDGLAYWTYLINPTIQNDEAGNSYSSFVQVAPTRQEEVVTESGAMNQWNFSYGGNYKDKLFFGLGLGVRSFSYRQEKTYTETVTVSNSELDSFVLTEKLYQDGTGFNLSAGFIYKPIPLVNLAINIHSPTIIRVSDSYNSELTVQYNNYPFYDEFQETYQVLNTESESSAIIESEYSVLTPTRIQAGIAVFFGKRGFWTADLEFLNYQRLFLFDAQPTFSLGGDNRTINNLYGNAVNFRTGAELRIDHIRLRGGMAYFSDPIATQIDDINRSRVFFTGGLGYRNAKRYIDFALIFRDFQQIYQPYSLSDGTAPVANIKNTQAQTSLSVGFYF